MSADGAGAFVCIRDFAQQYPMELEVTQDAVIAHLWPAHDAPVLDFTPSAVMGDEYPGDRVFWRDFYRGGLDSWTQGYGIAKTHNLQFSFHTRGESRGQTSGELRAFETPVLAFADPDYACDTWAFGRVEEDNPEQFPQIEVLVDAIIHRKYYLRNRLGNFGWIDYGDVNYQLAYPTDPEEIDYVHWRHWAQMFYGGPNVYPLTFMRSGDREAWDLARTNARHILDFDICHLDSEEGRFRHDKRRGGRYGGNGGICHYAANMYTLGCDCHTRFMLWEYYLNGNPRSWEVFEEFVSQYALRRHLPHNNAYRHRMTGGALRLFSGAYEATWNPEYLSCARQFADILYGAMEELGQTRYDDVYMNEGKVKYYQLTGEERMRELFLNDMRILSEAKDAHVFADTRATTLWGLAHAYWFTGDRSLLPFAMWQYEVATTRVPTEGEPHEIGAVGWTFEHAYESTLGNQLPAFAELLTTVEDPPAPTGPTSTTNGPIYLQETADGEFTFAVELKVYTRGVPGLGAARFMNWEQWAARLPDEDRPALILTAPDGSAVARYEVLGPKKQGAATFEGETGNGTVTFTVPADGQTGTYALAPSNQMTPMHMKLTANSLARAVCSPQDTWVYGMTQNFLVPAGTEDFSVAVKAVILRSEVGVTVRDASGEEVAGAEWNVSSGARHDWERLELNAGAPEEDEVWSIGFLAPIAAFLRFEGVPPCVSLGTGPLFVPDRTVDFPKPPQPEGDAPARIESPLADGGRALALPPDVGVSLAAPDDTPLMNEQEGTVEMWVRDTRQPTDLRNRSLLMCGNFHFYRRINIGTYVYMGPGYQTGIVPPPGRWVHLATTWRPSTEDEGKTEVAMYVDGVKVRNYYNQHLSAPEEWAGSLLQIPGQHTGLYVDELRISDVARYDGNFERPQTPFEADEHTLVLSHFDDNSALVKGAEVKWDVR